MSGNLLRQSDIPKTARVPGVGVAEAPGCAEATVREALSAAGPGWLAVRSATLAATVVWVRDASVELPAGIPSDAPRYTLAELNGLVLAGVTPADLRTLHAVKRTFPGAEIDWGRMVDGLRDVGIVARSEAVAPPSAPVLAAPPVVIAASIAPAVGFLPRFGPEAW